MRPYLRPLLSAGHSKSESQGNGLSGARMCELMRIFLLGDSDRQAAQVLRALCRNGYECPSDQVVPLSDSPRLLEARPDLVVLCLGPDPESALFALSEVRRGGGSPVIAVGPTDDPKLILRALRTGATEYVTEDELATEFDEALARLRGATTGIHPGKAFAVLGACGGSGASTVAVNVAAALARDHGGCTLIDLKLETGDLAALLDLQPQHTIADLSDGYGGPDRAMFEQSLVAHGSGLRLLASPRRQASAIRSKASLGRLEVTAGTVRELLNLARAVGPHTVVEVNPTFRDEQTEALRMADAVLVVIRFDFTSLRNARRALQHLDAVGIDRGRVRLVGNRHGQPHALPPAYAEEGLGLKLFHLVPDDPGAMNAATNIGDPAVLGLPKAPAARSLRQLAAALCGAAR
jgi:pilus assembly protein CpaE